MVYGQNFKNNENYFYGCGYGTTLEEADRDALVNLARSIEVKVSNKVVNTNKTVTKEGKIISRTNENISVSIVDTRVLIKRSKISVKKQWGKYKVYRYINKKEYVKESENTYNKIMSYIETFPAEPQGRDVNLLLGVYYRAYLAIDDVVLDILDENFIYKKEVLKRKARNLYGRTPSLYEYDRTNLGYVCTNPGSERKMMYAFEYSGDGGKTWHTPIDFQTETKRNIYNRMDGDYSIVSKYMTCWVQRNFRTSNTGKNMMCRILYEVLENGQTIKIDVPDEWYFCHGFIFMCR